MIIYFITEDLLCHYLRKEFHTLTTDSIIVNSGKNSILVIRCRECNSSVIFNGPTDIVYLYRLAEENPLLYAKPALNEKGLQFLLHLLQFIQQCRSSWICQFQFLN